MNEELVKHQLQVHEKRLNDHSKEIDELKEGRAASNVKMDNLCERLEAQTKSINWLIGIMATSLVGSFFMRFKQIYLNKGEM